MSSLHLSLLIFACAVLFGAASIALFILATTKFMIALSVVMVIASICVIWGFLVR